MHVVNDGRSEPRPPELDRPPWLRQDEPHDAAAVQPSRCDRPVRAQAPRRPPPRAAADRRRRRRGRCAGGGGSAYAVDVTEENFQALLEASMTAPVVLVFYSRAAGARERAAWPPTWRPSPSEYEGRFLAGLVDIDASPAIAQAHADPAGAAASCCPRRPAGSQPIQDALPLDELRTLLNQLSAAAHRPGHHRSAPAARAAAPRRRRPRTRSCVDPRYAAAQDALGDGDIDGAVAEYQKLVDANPADAEAAAGLAMAKVLQRTQGVDLQRRPRGRRGEPRRRRRPDPGRRPRHARRPRRRRVQPAGRPGPPYRRRRPQPGARAPARPLRGRRQRRPAGAARAARTSPPRCSEPRSSCGRCTRCAPSV